MLSYSKDQHTFFKLKLHSYLLCFDYNLRHFKSLLDTDYKKSRCKVKGFI